MNNMIIPARLAAVQQIFTFDFMKIRQRECRSICHSV